MFENIQLLCNGAGLIFLFLAAFHADKRIDAPFSFGWGGLALVTVGDAGVLHSLEIFSHTLLGGHPLANSLQRPDAPCRRAPSLGLTALSPSPTRTTRALRCASSAMRRPARGRASRPRRTACWAWPAAAR